MAGSFRLSVVTPEREVLAVEAKFVALPLYDDYRDRDWRRLSDLRRRARSGAVGRGRQEG